MRFVLIGSILGLQLLFQNCAESFHVDNNTSATSESQMASSSGDSNLGASTHLQGCSFNGTLMNEGDEVIAYQDSAPGDSCVSESRKCLNGSLGGTYAYATCQVAGPKSCLFNGRTIADGDSVTAFLKSTGASCVSEKRVCNDGVLSGQYAFSACQVDATRICDVTSISGDQKNCSDAPDLNCQKVSSVDWHVSLVDYRLNAPSGQYFYTCESQMRRYHHAYPETHIRKLLGDSRDISCMYYPASSVPINALTAPKMAWLCLPNQQNVDFTFQLENGTRCVLFNGVGTFYLCSGEQKNDQLLSEVASLLNKYRPGTVPFTCGYNDEKYAIIGRADLGQSSNSSEVNFACARLKSP